MSGSIVPAKLTGKELEQKLLEAVDRFEGIDGGRYGVQVSIMSGGEPVVMSSLPDLEGVLSPSGRQWIVECKVTSQASFRWWSRTEQKNQERQIRHLLRRGAAGALTGFLVHFNERELKTRGTIPARTFLVPMRPFIPFVQWILVSPDAPRTFTIELLEEHGIEVDWFVPDRCRNPYMDVNKLFRDLADFADQFDPDGFDYRDAPLLRGKIDAQQAKKNSAKKNQGVQETRGYSRRKSSGSVRQPVQDGVRIRPGVDQSPPF